MRLHVHQRLWRPTWTVFSPCRGRRDAVLRVRASCIRPLPLLREPHCDWRVVEAHSSLAHRRSGCRCGAGRQLHRLWTPERVRGDARGRTEGADRVRASATQQESRTRLSPPKRKRAAARSQAEETRLNRSSRVGRACTAWRC
eukprot:62643-Prymnesium_polylepis.1